MDSLRIASVEGTGNLPPCCRCAADQSRWDRIAGKAYCPNCQELLALGEAPPLVERTERRPCAACSLKGTVAYLSFPLNDTRAVEIDLCPEHLRALLGRRLGPHAFHQLRRQLRVLGLKSEDVFLLHEAFYDHLGRALQPAVSSE